MSELPISDEALDAAVLALYGRLNTREGEGPLALIQSEAGWPENARLAIQGFLTAEGFKVEYTAAYEKGNLRIPHFNGDYENPEWKKVEPLHRLVSKWVLDA